MANPIFNADQSNRLNSFQSRFFGNGGQNNFFQMLNQFRGQVQGDPQQMVQSLIDSGTMTKEQYEFFGNMAYKIMGRK